MQDSSSSQNPIQLFQELIQKLDEDDVLKKEQEDAWSQFAPCENHPGSLFRFLEWFLLERDSESLGSSPIAAWAPDSGDRNCPWKHLQGCSFSFYTVEEGGSPGLSKCTDLWNDQTYSCLLPQSLSHGDLILMGRFVHSGESNSFIPLPGMLGFPESPTTTALLNDLRKQKSVSPTSRLSQCECEKLLPGIDPAPSIQNPEQKLQALFEAREEWTWKRAANILEEQGSQALLDAVAFETGIDLALLRSLLLAMELEHPSAPQGNLSESSPLNTEQLGAALTNFEAKREAGEPLELIFDQLEEDLGIQAPNNGPQEPIGPAAGCGLGQWIDFYEWEMRGTNQEDSLNKEHLALFSEWAENQKGRPMDAQEISPAEILPFLCSEDVPIPSQERMESILPFLTWCQTEQGAGLEQFLHDLRGPLGERILSLAKLNEVLAGPNPTATSQLETVEPLQVMDESKELAPVHGCPTEWSSSLKPGDWLRGNWQDGIFQLSKVVPKEAIPVSSEADAET